MTREEAIKILEQKFDSSCRNNLFQNAEKLDYEDALWLAITALRTITQERVWKGEWIKRRKHRGGFRRVKGIDDIGEQHEVTIDERCEYDDLYCSNCGKQSPDNFINFCGYCGAPMTDEAVQMVMERLEALKDDKAD